MQLITLHILLALKHAQFLLVLLVLLSNEGYLFLHGDESVSFGHLGLLLDRFELKFGGFQLVGAVGDLSVLQRNLRLDTLLNLPDRLFLSYITNSQREL